MTRQTRSLALFGSPSRGICKGAPGGCTGLSVISCCDLANASKDEALGAVRVMPQTRAFGSTERHRSRTCLASGYDAVLVLKTNWGTGPSHSTADTNQMG
jgi:hypothetical protein